MDTAFQLVEKLSQHQLKLVLAESCTGGLVAAQIARVPGVSNWFCGSAVTYRSETKSAWLKIDPVTMDRYSAVSHEVASLMVSGVLRITPEADIAGAITGHFGPDAPPGFDGIVFVASALRSDSHPRVSRIQLTQRTRTSRQLEATNLLIQQLLERIQ